MNVANCMDLLKISSDSPIDRDAAVGLVTGDEQVRTGLSLSLYNASDDDLVQ